MDAIKFLIREHRKVKKMLAEIAKKSRRDATKRKMFATLSSDLSHHEKMEQTIWYPYLKKTTPLITPIKHLITEEKSAAKAITKIKKIKPQEEWQEKFVQFRKDVLHHASEEETKLFPKVKKSLDEQDLKDIGKKMQLFKKKLDASTKK